MAFSMNDRAISDRLLNEANSRRISDKNELRLGSRMKWQAAFRFRATIDGLLIILVNNYLKL
jgi:hypothetical protein